MRNTSLLTLTLMVCLTAGIVSAEVLLEENDNENDKIDVKDGQDGA